jgi:hypothetical protein
MAAPGTTTGSGNTTGIGTTMGMDTTTGGTPRIIDDPQVPKENRRSPGGTATGC